MDVPPHDSGPRLRAVPWLIYGSILGAVLCVSLAGPVPEQRTWALPVLCVAGLAWWWALVRAERWRIGRTALVLSAVLLRAAVLVGDPQLSDDVHRYAWEGAVLAEGFSPFAHPPDDPALAPLARTHRATHAAVNHRNVSAAYPPVVQLVGAAVALSVGDGDERDGGRAWARRARSSFRLVYTFCDLLLLWPLLALLKARGRAPAFALAWAWSPLVAFEFAGSAHFDSLGILLWIAALALAPARGVLAFCVQSVAVWVKLLPAVALPFLLPRAQRARALLGAVAATLLLFLPFAYLEGGSNAVGRGLSEYGRRWESSSLVYRFVEGALGTFLTSGDGWLDLRLVGRAVIGLAFLAVLVRARRSGTDALRASALLIGAFLVLTPTLHPWYVTWFVPFLAFAPRSPFAWLAVAMPLAYWPLLEWRASAVWIEPAWSWPILALPFFVLLFRPGRAALPT